MQHDIIGNKNWAELACKLHDDNVRKMWQEVGILAVVVAVVCGIAVVIVAMVCLAVPVIMLYGMFKFIFG